MPKQRSLDWAEVVRLLEGVSAVDDDPVTWARKVSGHGLDTWQTGLLESNSKRHLLLCTRQTGKSEAVALKASYLAAHSKRTVLCLSPTQRQSSILFGRITYFLRKDSEIVFNRSTRTEIELSNGSVLICLPGNNPDSVRGYTATDVVIDEAAFVRDTLLAVLMPMLGTTNGNLTMLSTPSGPEGPFYEAWTNEVGWTKVKVLGEDCPRISAEFLEEARMRMGDLAFRQEHGCEFIQSANSYFNAEIVSAAFEDVDDEEALQEAFGE